MDDTRVVDFFRMKEGEPKLLPSFLTMVQAGFPSPADDYLEKWLDLNQLMVAHPNATFFVKVTGNSMEGAKIFSGDILVVDRSLEPADGKIVVAIVNGEFTVKRLKIKNDQVYLVAENKEYSPIQVTEEIDFQIWGIVTFVIHRA